MKSKKASLTSIDALGECDAVLPEMAPESGSAGNKKKKTKRPRVTRKPSAKQHEPPQDVDAESPRSKETDEWVLAQRMKTFGSNSVTFPDNFVPFDPSNNMDNKDGKDDQNYTLPTTPLSSRKPSHGIKHSQHSINRTYPMDNTTIPHGSPHEPPLEPSTSIGTTSTSSSGRYPMMDPKVMEIMQTNLSVWLRIPNTAFGIGMGLAGQAVMWNSAGKAFNGAIDTQSISFVFWLLCIFLFGIIFIAYLYKAVFLFPLVEDEIRHGVRVHFFNMPHLIAIMLSVSVPQSFVVEGIVDVAAKRIVWVIAFLTQILITYNIYERWLFSPSSNITCARPQFLLSTVGWFLLANLGAVAEIERTWGLALPSFCFGVGIVFYIMVAISVFNGLHNSPNAKGSPALFLLMAPPSVGVIAFDNIVGDDNEIDVMSEVLFGWCLGVLLLLFKLGPKISQQPPSFGAYWAYVFPLAGLATAAIQIAWQERSAASQGLAISLIVMAFAATIIVFVREAFHSFQVIRGKAEWNDPLLSKERLAAATQRHVYAKVMENMEAA